MIGRSPQRN